MKIAIAGAGLAGLSAALVLAGEGFEVHVLEARQMPGGRATSYPVPDGNGGKEWMDNSQHILMRCCGNLLDLLERLGVADAIDFSSRFTFLEPGGRASVLEAGALPAPLHFAGSFLNLRFLSLRDKLAIARAMLALQRDFRRGPLLDSETMADWLRRHGQSPGALRNYWEPVLISAVNERLDRISAWQGIRVMHLGFVAAKRNYEMGVPRMALGELFAPARWQRPNLHLHFSRPVAGFVPRERQVAALRLADGCLEADAFVSALPYERLHPLFPELGLRMAGFAHSPIAGIHLRFHRPVTSLPHAALLGSTIQWFFAKEEGRTLSLVVSASHSLAPMSRDAIVQLALQDLAQYLPAVRDARLLSSHVIRETRATFVAAPGFERQRPGPRTRFANFFLAGEWTNTGWPSTMEGAVLSGYRAAERVCALAGRTRSFVLPTAPA